MCNCFVLVTALVAAVVLPWPNYNFDFLPDVINFFPKDFSIPSWLLFLLAVGPEVIGLTRGIRTVAHGTHLGGTFVKKHPFTCVVQFGPEKTR